MASYKCCHCDNILTTQGPINAMVTYLGGSFHSYVSVKSSGAIHEKSLNEVFPKFIGNDFSIISQNAIGTLNTFSIKSEIKTFAVTQAINSFKQNVTIHCDNCDKFCNYSIE